MFIICFKCSLSTSIHTISHTDGVLVHIQYKGKGWTLDWLISIQTLCCRFLGKQVEDNKSKFKGRKLEIQNQLKLSEFLPPMSACEHEFWKWSLSCYHFPHGSANLIHRKLWDSTRNLSCKSFHILLT